MKHFFSFIMLTYSFILKKRKNLSAGAAAHLLSVKMEFVFAWNITLETDITVNVSSSIPLSR